MDTEKQQDRAIALRTWEVVEQAESLEHVFPQLEFLLTQPYRTLRMITAELLGEVKSDASVTLLGVALNDRCFHVAEAAAKSLAKIGTAQALDILRRAFLEDELDRPHHLANAIAQFGREGYEILQRSTTNKSPTLRYFAAKCLGATGFEEIIPLLENMAQSDLEKTRFGGLVATGAKAGLKTFRRMEARRNG